MRFVIQLPTERVADGDEFVGAEAISEMARVAEKAGFDACSVTEHPIPPEPWLASGGHHSLDPWVTLAFAAAATTRIRVQTNVAVLPYRSPFLTAKAAATLDVLSGGRVILGASPGYLRGEFEALGADFERRNQVTDEAITAIRQAWTGKPIALSGIGFQARNNRMLPRPIQRPGPPIWIGGNSRRAIRRAVLHGDGWQPFPTAGIGARVRTAEISNLAELKERITYLHDYAAAIGREAPTDICFVPFHATMLRPQEIEAAALSDSLEDLDRVGVTWASLFLPGRNRAEFCDAMRRFGEALGLRG